MDIFFIKEKSYLITVDYYSDFWEVDELPENPRSKDVIKKCKVNFSRYGIPDVVVTDGGSQFDSEEFRSFSREWEFGISITDPYHSQSNGKAESAVKIAKKLLKKAKDQNKDVYKALLDWRNTPTAGIGSSPAQRLMARRTKTLLPTAEALLHQAVQANVVEKLVSKKQKIQRQHDKTAKDLPPLRVGEVIRMKPSPGDSSREWKRGRCLKQLGKRSYVVNVDGRAFQRNRRFLRSTREAASSEEESEPDDPSPTTQPLSDKTTAVAKSDRQTAGALSLPGANSSLTNLDKRTTPEEQNSAMAANTKGVEVAARPRRQSKKPARYADFVEQ
jgi:hypothetical protein